MKSIDDTDTDFFLALITKHFYVDVTNIRTYCDQTFNCINRP